MRKLFLGLVFATLLPCMAQAQPKPQPEPGAALTYSNKIEGLTLPPDAVVNFDESFVRIVADCKGKVRWLVLGSSDKVKYYINPATPNEVIVGIPPTGGTISIFCNAVIGDVQTEFAQTTITIKGATPAPPVTPPVNPPGPPGPPAPPADVALPLHVSIIDDPAVRTPEARAVIEDKALRDKLKAKKAIVRVYSINDTETLRAKGFDRVIGSYKPPILIVTDDKGKALILGTLPASSAELEKALAAYTGGQ